MLVQRIREDSGPLGRQLAVLAPRGGADWRRNQNSLILVDRGRFRRGPAPHPGPRTPCVKHAADGMHVQRGNGGGRDRGRAQAARRFLRAPGGPPRRQHSRRRRRQALEHTHGWGGQVGISAGRS